MKTNEEKKALYKKIRFKQELFTGLILSISGTVGPLNEKELLDLLFYFKTKAKNDLMLICVCGNSVGNRLETIISHANFIRLINNKILKIKLKQNQKNENKNN
jgi:hypothetical protein